MEPQTTKVSYWTTASTAKSLKKLALKEKKSVNYLINYAVQELLTCIEFQKGFNEGNAGKGKVLKELKWLR